MTESRRDWQVTFADMLTLLLTFFVFVLAVAKFKTADFRQFWGQAKESGTETQAGGSLLRFPLIPGIAPIFLSAAAEELMRDVHEALEEGSGRGADVYYSENKLTLWIPEEFGFILNETEPSQELRTWIRNKLVPALSRGEFPVKVEGHSDNLPSRGLDNYEISMRRALATAALLLAEGIAPERLSVAAYGPHRPMADNKTETGRMINRRVEIQVILNY